MRYWIYGLDAISKEPREPLFLEADSEANARKQAAEMGMAVEEVEAVEPRSRQRPSRGQPLKIRRRNTDMQSEPVVRMSPAQWFWLLAVIGVAVGLLGAMRFAEAAGFASLQDRDSRTILVYISGIVLALLTYFIGVLLVKGTLATMTHLARTSTRPPSSVALTLIICGVVCLVAALGFSLWYATSSTGAASSVQMGAGTQEAKVTVRAGGSLVFPFLVIGVFITGVAIVALGFWSSIKPSEAPRVPPVNSRVPSTAIEET